MNFNLSFSSIILSLFLAATSFAQDTATEEQRIELTEHYYIDADGKHRILSGASLIYRTLIAEVAIGQGEYELASETLLDLAYDTGDARFAERAFRLAMADQNLYLGLESARL